MRMETFHYLSEGNIHIFLIQVLILLSFAKLLSGLIQRWGWPALVGEILCGIIFGPTIFGRLLPGLYATVFPADLIQQNMLETVSWFGVLFLLLVTGFEVRLSSVWKQGKAALTIGVVGVVIPLLIGLLVFYWIPESYWGVNSGRVIFTLFLATAAAISAIPVIAKILHDLEILKSDLGLTTISAFVINDILGWIVFAVVLGLAATHTLITSNPPLRIFFEILLFGALCLTIGSKIIGHFTRWIKKTPLPQTATILTLITCLGMLCGIITQWIGIHAILGFFLAGIMAGNTAEISERNREIISQVVHAIFVPLFFVSIGLKIDFIGNLDLLMIVLFTLVAIVGKFVGAWLGGRWAQMSPEDAVSIGIAHIPGGAMEIIIGLLALEMQLISHVVFVAIVFAAVLSSVLVGPLLAWSLERRKYLDIGDFVAKTAIIPDLASPDRWGAIEELSNSLSAKVLHYDPAEIVAAVKAREEVMGTGLEQGIAVPHARLKDLKTPVIAFGRAKLGIDWDARDGLLARFVFLVLTPEKEEGRQAQIVAAIARYMLRPKVKYQLMATNDPEKMFSMLKSGLKLKQVRPRKAV